MRIVLVVCVLASAVFAPGLMKGFLRNHHGKEHSTNEHRTKERDALLFFGYETLFDTPAGSLLLNTLIRGFLEVMRSLSSAGVKIVI